MSLVLDASVALSWYFEDERTEASDDLLDRVALSGAVVPALWYYEVASGLRNAVRRKRIDLAHRDASLAELRLLPISVDDRSAAGVWDAPLHLAGSFGLTIYGAAYVELAHRRGLPLATNDEAMRAAAQKLTVALLG